MKVIALLGFVLSTAAVGAVRFGGWMPPSAWLDVPFIACAAGAVGTAVSLIIARLHGVTHHEWTHGLEQRDDSTNRQHDTHAGK